jgi:hypothetical protein
MCALAFIFGEQMPVKEGILKGNYGFPLLNIGVRLQRIVQQPTNFKRATGTFEIVYCGRQMNSLP